MPLFPVEFYKKGFGVMFASISLNMCLNLTFGGVCGRDNLRLAVGTGLGSDIGKELGLGGLELDGCLLYLKLSNKCQKFRHRTQRKIQKLTFCHKRLHQRVNC